MLSTCRAYLFHQWTRKDKKIVDAILPVQEAYELEVDIIGAVKDMKLGGTVLKDGRVAIHGMDKLEQVIFLRANVRLSRSTS